MTVNNFIKKLKDEGKRISEEEEEFIKIVDRNGLNGKPINLEDEEAIYQKMGLNAKQKEDLSNKLRANFPSVIEHNGRTISKGKKSLCISF